MGEKEIVDLSWAGVDISYWLEKYKKPNQETNMKLTLKSGAVVTGTKDEIARLLSAGVEVEPNSFLYYSESKGVYIPISSMDIRHIRNAMLKMYRVWAGSLSEFWGDELVERIAAGPSDETFLGLYRTYTARHYNEEL